ncbi:MAG: glycosyltransferase family 4 protein [Rhodospirillales bacterium]
MRILIVTDAWHPQVNGVVRTIETVTGCLRAMGHAVEMVTPAGFTTIPCPTYPEIRLAIGARCGVARAVDAFRPEAIHVATEGPLGLAARALCRRRGVPFTTSFHTRFPEYVHARIRFPVAWSYALVRRFHNAAARTMVATETLRRELAGRGFGTMALWGRGVDETLFRPRAEPVLDLPRPVFLYVGRVAVEKNVEDFLRLELPGTKVVVGDGPQLERCRARYPAVRFLGAKSGDDLARHYAAADAFVFPSRTDTFGNVILEALASGVPVAAYPVAGPQDVIGNAPVGALDDDLRAAALRALAIPREACRAFALTRTWRASAEQFLGNLAPIGAVPLVQPSPS